MLERKLEQINRFGKKARKFIIDHLTTLITPAMRDIKTFFLIF